MSIPLADYLFTRLRQLGVDSLFGVPGDYNLTLLDHVEPSGLHWVGNANELNAGYAADGYARIKGVGAFVTTFGVGELSAVNAVAGAYAERAAVVHVVGSPPRRTQEDRLRVHHTFNDGEYGRFARVAEEVTVASARLRDPRTAAEEVDRVLRECVAQCRPVYLDLPADMVETLVDAGRLEKRIEVEDLVVGEAQRKVCEKVLERVRGAKRPVIVVDGETRSLGITEVVEEIVKATGWPTWTTAFGKGLMDESIPNFFGVYQGNFGGEDIRTCFNEADLVISFGTHNSSTNTYAFSSVTKDAITISLEPTSIILDGQKHRDISIQKLVKDLLAEVQKSPVASHPRASELKTPSSDPPSLPSDGVLHQASLWSALNPLLQPGDIILGETGTAGHGARHFHLPPHCRMFLPVTWLSIGYMLPASLGAALAQRDLRASNPDHVGDRTLLFIGDGSFQMTAQELSTIIREDLNVVVFLLNNDGYTIERCIHGLREGYNDVARWKYLLAPTFFGAREGTWTKRVERWGELKQVVDGAELKDKGLRMVELVLEREDAPEGPLKVMLGEQQRLAQAK
ncbi:hypothetical protein CAC42_4369 [Sphaceloma murrayae]|uniref:Pyruvate decarboxylase n=1 Tax=Sphaceloma murrayae TaxID=2082308 RepID=A0A2K1QLE0_9PEZI|nr:hypothetical protein CAC42_4369 [Sphaceloma murrayae]